MNKRLFSILCLVFCLGSVAFGQIKTITNADLEKYRQKRLQDEREYLENYQRLGLPSPAELERQREQSAKERTELVQRLEQEQIQREYYTQQQQPIYVIQSVTINNRRSNRPYYYNYPYGFYYFRFPRTQTQPQNNQLQPIRPPKPIPVPLFLQTNRNF